MGPLNIVRADAHRAAHIDAKNLRAASTELIWHHHGLDHYVAGVRGGSYVLRKVDSGSRIKRHRYRWKALWAPIDSPDIKELALERRKDWARGAAEAHYKRRNRAATANP